MSSHFINLAKMENHTNWNPEVVDSAQPAASVFETHPDHINGPQNQSQERDAQTPDVPDGDTYESSKAEPLLLNPDVALPSVKTEPISSTLGDLPASDDIENKFPAIYGASDYPTSRTVANLKNHGLSSRASSTDRSSPANSVKLPSNKKTGSAATKKGTAKKPANKKRKVNDLDAESIDGSRSNTPASRTGKGSGKKQSSVSIAGSPAPDDKKKRKKKPPKGHVAEEDDEEYEDENEIFCICRRPDNHTWMIGCDGGCEDWFHGKCVNIDPRDADLIEKYICPNCGERGKGVTTWKRKCRLAECRRPARATPKDPSKYCSDDHGREFMRRNTSHMKRGSARKGIQDLGSMGGVLTAGDLKAMVVGVSSVQEFRKLGNRIMSPPPALLKEESPKDDVKSEITPPTGDKPGLDITAQGVEYSSHESAKLEKLRNARDALLHRKDMLAARSAFVEHVRQRAKGVVAKLKQKEPKGGWKDICGFDARLAWADEEFDEWRLSDAGTKALAEGTLEAMASSFPTSTDADGDTAMNGEEEDEMAFLARGICVKKRCEQHKQWVKVQQQNNSFEEKTTDQDLLGNEQEARAVAESAVLRHWAGKQNSLFE